MAKQCVTYLQKKVHWTDTVTIATKLRRFPNIFNQKKPTTNVRGKRNDRKFAKYFIDRVTYFRIRDKWEEFFLIAHFVYFFYVQQVLFSLRQKMNKKTPNSKSNSCFDAGLLVACAVVFVYYLFCLWLFRFFDIFIANIRKTQISSKLLIAPVLLSVISSLFQAFCLPETTSPSYKNSL